MIDKIKNSEIKKLVVIGTKRSNDEVLEQLKRDLPNIEIVYYDDYLFIPNITQSNWNLPEHILNRIEALKELDADAILVTSSRFNNKLAKRINDITKLEVIYDKPVFIDGPIVVLDSGLGGVNVAKNLHEKLPTEDIIVLTDNKNMPIGNKDVRIISRRATQLIKYIKTINPKLVVLACNTFDAVAGEKIAAQLGGIKLIDIINSTARSASQITNKSEIALIATPRAIESQQYMYKLLMHTSSKHLIGLSCENLAKSIENNDNIKQVFNEELEPLDDFDFETIILGCTHYTKVSGLVKKRYPEAKIVDSAQIVVDDAVNYLNDHDLLQRSHKGSISVVVTKEEADEQKLLNNLNEKEVKITLLEI